ncbi:hypothetical protein EVAR_55313_1 [Eumeta japonica]|uniref:Uncharacterized protein n=1 Tax=Eumeta variegata TaxID=151549 RepID=A0A4C1ZCE3_EUMVA|nr:hypothetical protein EVAR_55313_1 [Eumeta japonica]
MRRSWYIQLPIQYSSESQMHPESSVLTGECHAILKAINVLSSCVLGVGFRACRSVCDTAQYSPCVDSQTTCIRSECSLWLTVRSARRAFARFLSLACTPTGSRF